MPRQIMYSAKYTDEEYEYRHVILPDDISRNLWSQGAKGRLLEETEWRGAGVQQSRGWVHYAVHR